MLNDRTQGRGKAAESGEKAALNHQKNETRKLFFSPFIKKEEKKITGVRKGGCICSATEDLSSSFLVGEADSRREQDKEKSWSGLHLPGAHLGQRRVKLGGCPSVEARARAGDGTGQEQLLVYSTAPPTSCPAPRCTRCGGR